MTEYKSFATGRIWTAGKPYEFRGPAGHTYELIPDASGFAPIPNLFSVDDPSNPIQVKVKPLRIIEKDGLFACDMVIPEEADIPGGVDTFYPTPNGIQYSTNGLSLLLRTSINLIIGAIAQDTQRETEDIQNMVKGYNSIGERFLIIPYPRGYPRKIEFRP